MTTREQAVARYGSYWKPGYGTNADVTECLGAEDTEEGAGALQAAVATARERRMTGIARKARRAAEVLASNRLTVALLRLGWHRRSAHLMEIVRGHEADIAALKVALSDGTACDPVQHPLPELMRLPVPIAIGTTLWEVGWEWPLRHGVRLRRLQVKAVRLYEGRSDAEWYSSVIYDTERLDRDGSTPSGAPSFTYDRDDFANPEVDMLSNGNSALFLTREAAEAKLLEMANILESRAVEARGACLLQA